MKLINDITKKENLTWFLKIVENKEVSVENFKKIMFEDHEEEVDYVFRFLYYHPGNIFRNGTGLYNFDLLCDFIFVSKFNKELTDKKIKVISKLISYKDYTLIEKMINIFNKYDENEFFLDFLSNYDDHFDSLITFFDLMYKDIELFNHILKYVFVSDFNKINYFFNFLSFNTNNIIYLKIRNEILSFDDQYDAGDDIYFYIKSRNDINELCKGREINVLFENEDIFNYVTSSLQDMNRVNISLIYKLLSQISINEDSSLFFEVLAMSEVQLFYLEKILSLFDFDDNRCKVLTVGLLNSIKISDNNSKEIYNVFSELYNDYKSIDRAIDLTFEDINSLDDITNIILSINDIELNPMEYVKKKYREI